MKTNTFKYSISDNVSFTKSGMEVKLYGNLWLDNQSTNERQLQAAIKASDNLLSILASTEGDFTITITDHSKKKIHLITDAFATKTIYFTVNQQERYFSCSTTLKSIVQEQPNSFEINWDLLTHRKPHITQPKYTYPTFVKEINRLRGGCILTLNLDDWKYQIQDYISKPKTIINKPTSYFISSYRELLESSIMRRLNGYESATIPLSGGFDSSIIFALAKNKIQLNAASICSYSSLHNHEIDRARELTISNNSPHLILPISFEKGANLNEWINLIISSENVESGLESYLKSQLIRHISNWSDTKLILSGTGSDQLNGGTTTYDFSPKGLHSSWESFIKEMVKTKWQHFQKKSLTEFFQFSFNFATTDLRNKIYPLSLEKEWDEYIEKNKQFLFRKSTFQESKLFHANGFDMRFPFLDRSIMRLLSSIPSSLYPELLFDKQILRKAFHDVLPGSYHGKPKFFRVFQSQEKIYRYFRKILYEQNFKLIKLAFEVSPSLRKAFDIDKIISFLQNTRESNYYPAYSNILIMVNIGLLDASIFRNENIMDGAFPNNTLIYQNAHEGFDRTAIQNKVLPKKAEEVWEKPLIRSKGLKLYQDCSNKNDFILINNTGQAHTIRKIVLTKFIQKINDIKSTNQILATLNFQFEEIEEELKEIINSSLLEISIFQK